MKKFCQYAFQNYVKARISKEGTPYCAPTDNQMIIDNEFDSMPTHELVYQLGYFLTEEGGE